MEELAPLFRLLLGWLLLVGRLAKLVRFGEFRSAVAGYQLLPPTAVWPAV